MFNDGFWTLAPPLPQVEVNPNRDKLTVQEVPEPFTLVLFATGLAGVAIRSRKKTRDSSGLLGYPCAARDSSYLPA